MRQLNITKLNDICIKTNKRISVKNGRLNGILKND